MTKTLREILRDNEVMENATAAGTRMHARLGRVVIDGDAATGDEELVRRIRQNAALCEFFSPLSRIEVPVAGRIGDRFVSRRLDRVVVDDACRRIMILDYKTDVDRVALRPKSVAQLREYAALLSQIYPDYKISGHILWTHDWTLENILK